MIQDRVTIQEAARITNISRQTLYRWIEKGLLSRDKDKNLSYVSLAEVRALCNQSDKQNDTDNITSDNHDTQRNTGKVTVDVTYLEGLMVRLGQYEAERRYLLEYKTGLEEKDKELAEIKQDAERGRAELDQAKGEIDRLRGENERLKAPFWRRWFKK